MRLLPLTCIFLMSGLAACEGWSVQPPPYTTPVPVPTRTAAIYSPTAMIATTSATGASTAASATAIGSAGTTSPAAEPSLTFTPMVGTVPAPSSTVSTSQVGVQILGCSTGLDLAHGMGAVTNAYVRISNLGTHNIESMCATLNVLDEGRPHPDKTKCAPALGANHQITFKLTVDTTFKQNSPIQVDLTSNNVLLMRAGKESCANIGLFPPKSAELGVESPVP
jgi:hypothetical protein